VRITSDASTLDPFARRARRPDLAERNRRPRPDVAARNRGEGTRLYEDKGWMSAAYLDRRLSLRQIAAEMQCSLRTVARWMEIHGIARRSISEGKVLNIRRGPEAPNWKGAAICPQCGGARSYRSRTCRSCNDIVGDKNPKWRGENVSYPGMHCRVKAQRGAAGQHQCQWCDRQADEWAYDHTDPDEKRDGYGPFSTDINRYLPLCIFCHRSFDKAQSRKRKEMTE
jgi:hypothetical protein